MDEIISFVKKHKDVFLASHPDLENDVELLLKFSRKNYSKEVEITCRNVAIGGDVTSTTGSGNSDENNTSEDNGNSNVSDPPDDVDILMSPNTNSSKKILSSETQLKERLPQQTTEELQAILRKLNPKITTQVKSTLLKNINKWLSADPYHRPYVLLTKSDLQEKYKEQKGQCPIQSWSNGTLIDKLTALEDEHQTSNNPLDYKEELLSVLLKSGFGMKGLTGKSNEYCCKGHDLEPIVAKSYATKHGYFVVFSTGLVRQSSNRCIQGSIDHILAFKDEDYTICITSLEIKS